LHCRNTKHSDGESKAASGLGEVYLQMAEYDKAMEYHQLDYDLSEAHQDIEGKVSFEIKILKGVQNWPHRPTSGLGSKRSQFYYWKHFINKKKSIMKSPKRAQQKIAILFFWNLLECFGFMEILDYIEK
jgi:hypothetical protein